jgi:hypothetical protein
MWKRLNGEKMMRICGKEIYFKVHLSNKIILSKKFNNSFSFNENQ